MFLQKCRILKFANYIIVLWKVARKGGILAVEEEAEFKCVYYLYWMAF